MEAITTLSLFVDSLNSARRAKRGAFSVGPMLQSVLMGCIDDSYATQLHASGFNPYSQYCFENDKGEVVWKISALTNEAADRLIVPASKIDSFTLNNLDETFVVARKQIESFGVNSLLAILKGETDSSFRVRFVTPTAFKCKGQYVIMPDIRLIFQNLLMRYNQVYAGDCEIDSETVDYIVQNVKITSYNLRSEYFPRTMAKADKIPAFVGTVTLHVAGPQSLKGLVSMLLTFGEASGIGIKTSMGMGGMQLIRESSTRKGGTIGR